MTQDDDLRLLLTTCIQVVKLGKHKFAPGYPHLIICVKTSMTKRCITEQESKAKTPNESFVLTVSHSLSRHDISSDPGVLACQGVGIYYSWELLQKPSLPLMGSKHMYFVSALTYRNIKKKKTIFTCTVISWLKLSHTQWKSDVEIGIVLCFSSGHSR